MPKSVHPARPRRRLTPASLRAAARRRALVGAMLAVGAASVWVVTDRGDDARDASGWETGFIRQTADGEHIEWIPHAGAEQVVGGFTDWSPTLLYAGQPLPSDVAARWTCSYDYERFPVGRAAPLVQRAELQLVIADPNFAPFAAGMTARFFPATRAALLRRAREASIADGEPSDLALALAVAPPAPGDQARVAIYWNGLPRQVAIVAGACLGVALLFSAIRPIRRARLLMRTRSAQACPRCLYDTTASPDRCPECAQPLL